MLEEGYFSVTALNNYIKKVIDNDEILKYVALKGEISSIKMQSSTGHYYLIIKDDKSYISGVMFSSDASSLTFIPKEGDEVLIMGRVSTFPARGQYQIYIYDMQLAGVGNLLLELEKLKKKLLQEGLFDESRKRPINKYPKRIGVITAKGSAASADIIKNINRRYPLCEIYLFPSLVQGKDAPKDLLRAFNLSQNYDLDTLIIGRGGGSNEDLSAFNDETLVRAVAKSKCPTISAVGHEIDFTLIDYVADKRVSTPTGAAELATIDILDIKINLMHSDEVLTKLISNKIESYKHALELIKNKSFFLNPLNIYKDKANKIKELSERIYNNLSLKINVYKERVNGYNLKIASLNPKSVLTRGYAIISDEKGNVVKSIKDLKINQELTTEYSDGKIKTKVIDIINKESL